MKSMDRTTEQFAYAALFAYQARWSDVRWRIYLQRPRGESRRRVRSMLAALGALSSRA